jgi:transcriptional regulator with XRE-family HTH domain
MTGAELRAWRVEAGLSLLAAAEALGLEPYKLEAYESGAVPIPDYVEKLVDELKALGTID